MKYAVLALICIIAAVFADPMVLDERIIERVNNDPKATWKAGMNEVFKGKRMSEIQHMLGAFLINPATDRIPKFSYDETNDIPKEFDSYTNWPSCKHAVRDQGKCGSCWAFSAAQALGDRYCIKHSDASFPVLSPQDMVSCDHSDYGCRGGYLTNTWRYLEQYGIVTDQCFPYKSGQSGFVPSCPSQCENPSQQWKKYKTNSGSTKHFASVQDAQQDIVKNGPVQAGFMVYQDFFSYSHGVYHHVSGGLAGGHAVEVIGWGVEASTGTPYWNVKNSWGTGWGNSGYFWIKRGNDECQFESQLYVGDAI